MFTVSGVCHNLLRGRLVLCRVGYLFNAVQPESRAGELNVVVDVLPLPGQLIWLHLEPLYELRVNAAACTYDHPPLPPRARGAALRS